MAAFLDVCRFTPTAGGTTDWTYSFAVTGYQGPASANAVNGRVYKFRAESADLSQWELAEGTYNSSTGVFARSTVLYNSAGTGTLQGGAGIKINFSTVPQIAVVALKEDLLSIEEANNFTAAQQAQGRANLGLDKLYFSARLSANQAVVAPSTFQKIPFDVEDADPSNWYDNTTNFRFQPTIAGKYRVHSQMQAIAGASLSEIDIDIRKNRASYSRTIILASGAASSSLIDQIVPLNGSTDYLEIFGLVGGTGTLTIIGGTAPIRTWFEAQYVGP